MAWKCRQVDGQAGEKVGSQCGVMLGQAYEAEGSS